MERLAATDGLVIAQQKEWSEILTGFEARNRYAVSDSSGQRLYLAAESGSLLLRWLLKALRPFTMILMSEEGREVLRVVRPFRFYFHRAEVLDAQGRRLATVERRFSLLRRIYEVTGSTDEPLFELFGPLLHPWTFHIRREGADLGKIAKKWSGLLKEGFTDADNFGVSFPADWDTHRKAVALGAVFLLDCVYFDR